MKTHVKEVRFVELSARKQAILTAIVKAYISTGEPIGSKILCEMLDNSPSSATLRNEMSELVKLGLSNRTPRQDVCRPRRAINST